VRGSEARALLKHDLPDYSTHAQSLKPGAGMPDITEFIGEDPRALVAYMGILK
jgi:hypothetical protein